MFHGKPYLQEGVIDNSHIPHNITPTERIANSNQFYPHKFILLKYSGYTKHQTLVCICMIVACQNAIIIGQLFEISACTLN